MLFCNQCKKEVVIYGVSHSEGIEDDLNELRDNIEEQGKLILFNPPPIGTYSCPNCFRKLEEKG